jgi:hypothetical protein
MTVLHRVKRSNGTALQRRARGDREPTPSPGRGERAPIRLARRSEQPVQLMRPDYEPRRLPPAPQDRAVYSCACGFVFAQEVSTSVACPHCGGTQAW